MKRFVGIWKFDR